MMDQNELLQALKREVDKAILDARVVHTRDMVIEAYKAAGKLEQGGATVDQIARALGVAISTARSYSTSLWREGILREGPKIEMPRMGGGRLEVNTYYVED